MDNRRKQEQKEKDKLIFYTVEAKKIKRVREDLERNEYWNREEPSTVFNPAASVQEPVEEEGAVGGDVFIKLIKLY